MMENDYMDQPPEMYNGNPEFDGRQPAGYG